MQVTDSQEELFDLVDKKDRVIGTVTRGEANRNPKLIHRSVAILVYNRKGELFLQKRSKTKDTYPGYWTISVSGHVQSGKTYDRAAREELAEELGITKPANLKRIGKELMHYPNETEHEAFYTLVSDGPFRLHPEEIEEGRFFPLNREFFRSVREKMKITPELEFIVRTYLLDKKYEHFRV